MPLSGYHFLLNVIRNQQTLISCLLHLCGDLLRAFPTKAGALVSTNVLTSTNEGVNSESANKLNDLEGESPLSTNERIEVIRSETKRYWQCVSPTLSSSGVTESFARAGERNVLLSPAALMDLNLNQQDQQSLADIFSLLCMVIEESLAEQIPQRFRTLGEAQPQPLQSLLGTSESLTVMILGRELLMRGTPHELHEAQLAYVNYNSGILSLQLKPAEQRSERDYLYYRSKMMFSLINLFCKPSVT